MTVPVGAQPGDFMVVRTRGWQAWCIRLGTRSRYNHAAILDDSGHLVEAQPGGVIRVPADTYAGCEQVWSTGRVQLDGEGRRVVVWAALSCLGRPYGWADIAAISLSVAGVRWGWVDRRLRDPHTLICSQMVAWAWSVAGHDLVPTKDDCRTTPGNLADVLEGRPVSPYYLRAVT